MFHFCSFSLSIPFCFSVSLSFILAPLNHTAQARDLCITLSTSHACGGLSKLLLNSPSHGVSYSV